MSRLYPYASTLRSIGQALENLGIEAFDLRCDDDEFHLQCGDPNPPHLMLIELSYSLKDIESLERENRARRRGQSGLASVESLSGALRVLGWLVDTKSGRLRRICNSESAIGEEVWRLEYRASNRDVITEEFDMRLLHETSLSMRKERVKTASRR